MSKWRLLNLSFIIMLMSVLSCTFDNMFLHPTKLEKSEKYNIEKYPSGKQLIVVFDDNKNPAFYDNTGNKHYTDIKISSHKFISGNNNKIHALLLENKTTYNGINLLFLHGNAGSILSHFQIAAPLAQKGFKVFLPDYSGFGFSEGKASRKNLKIDGEAALKYFHNLIISSNSSENLYIYGQSIGGHLAAVLAAENQELIDALIIEGAFTSHKKIAAHVTGLGFIARAVVRELYSAEKSIKENHKPSLIIHSTQDEVIPFFMGKNLYNKANEPKSFLKIDKRHVFGPIYYSDIITEKILNLNPTSTYEYK